MSKIDKKLVGSISRRDFLKDAGILAGGAVLSSSVFLASCDGEQTEVTKTVTTTTSGGAITTTVTKFVCPVCNQEFDTLAALGEHLGSVHPGEGEIITKYVCPNCSEGFSSLGALRAHMAEAHLIKDSDIISLTVNGRTAEVLVKPGWTLRDVLREEFAINSVKDMCDGYGACGSCTVIMNGRPVLSCMALAIECGGGVIETAENLGETNHPLVDAYAKNFCAQCGYCTPGFVVTAKALLDRNPNPSEEEIRDALGGNLCRCGTYPAHINAIKETVGHLQGGA